MKWAVSQNPSRQTRRLNYLQSKTKHPTFRVSRLTFSVPSPGRSVTQARRLYESRLANFRVSDPRYGVANKDVSYRQPSQGPLPPSLAPVTLGRPCPADGESGGHPVPSLRAYTACHDTELARCPRMDECPCSQGWREGTVVSTERGVTQVPFWPLPPTSRQPLSLPRAQSRLALQLKS